MTGTWYERWKSAYEQAAFYKSEKNTAAYWDEAAKSQSSGLGGTEHIEKICGFLTANGYLENCSTILDVGCGCGEYSLYFAKKCKCVTAMDYSKEMLTVCEANAKMQNITNVSYLEADIKEYEAQHLYDGVFACLNPSTYSPDIFQKLLFLSKNFLVYFSMDTPIENVDEPIYCGTNSVLFPEKYLEELRIPFEKLPYVYQMKGANKKEIQIPFAYLIIDMREENIRERLRS